MTAMAAMAYILPICHMVKGEAHAPTTPHYSQGKRSKDYPRGLAVTNDEGNKGGKGEGRSGGDTGYLKDCRGPRAGMNIPEWTGCQGSYVWDESNQKARYIFFFFVSRLTGWSNADPMYGVGARRGPWQAKLVLI